MSTFVPEIPPTVRLFLRSPLFDRFRDLGLSSGTFHDPFSWVKGGEPTCPEPPFM